jgi:hypothetical protein
MMTIEDVGEGELEDLLDRTMHPNSHPRVRARRTEFWSRYLIQTDNFDPLLQKRIREVYEEPDIILEVMKWAIGFFNPQKRAVNRLAVAYKKRPTRKLDKANKTVQREFEAYLRRAQFNLKARKWNRFAVAMNTVIVLPLLKRTESGDPTIDYRMVTGSIAEVIEDPDTPHGSEPGVLCYALPKGSRDPFGRPACVVTVDARWYIYWTENREPAIVEHGLDMFPGSTLRMSEPPDECWWDWTSDSGMTRTVMEVGFIAAAMNWTRKTQCRKLIAQLVAEEHGGDSVPTGQTIGDPEGAYELRGVGTELRIEDLRVEVDHFLAQIKALQDEALELKTGAIASLADPDPKAPLEGQQSARQHAAVSEHREAQTGQCGSFETRLHVVTAKMTRRAGIDGMPAPEVIADGLTHDWPPLPYIDTPQERTRVWVERTKFGTMDQVDAYMEDHDVDEDTALAELKAKAERRAEVLEIITKRNVPNDPTRKPDDAQPGESLPAQQGRAGGQQSGISRNEQAPAQG